MIVLGIWAVPRTGNLENKSNAADLASAVADDMRSRATSWSRSSPSSTR